MNNKNFNKKHLKFLYEKANDHYRAMRQWSSMNNYDLAYNYQTKLEAIIELMESIYCFNVGMGADQKSRALSNRLTSFNFLK